MKKISVVILLVIFSFKANCQNFVIAGNYLESNYYHVTYDPYKIVSGNDRDSLDFEGDGIYDFGIKTININNVGITERGIYIFLLDTTIELAYDYQNYRIKIISDSDTINSPNQQWRNSDWLQLTLSVPEHSISVGYVWISAGEKYIGYRLIKASDTLYGWVKVDVVTYDRIDIYESLCQSHITLDTTFTNVSSINFPSFSNKIELYPNPATESITIETTDISKQQTITIYNMQGQLLMQQAMQQPKTVIDISRLAKGVYVIKLSTEDGVAVRKFIKE